MKWIILQSISRSLYSDAKVTFVFWKLKYFGEGVKNSENPWLISQNVNIKHSVHFVSNKSKIFHFWCEALMIVEILERCPEYVFLYFDISFNFLPFEYAIFELWKMKHLIQYFCLLFVFVNAFHVSSLFLHSLKTSESQRKNFDYHQYFTWNNSQIN